MGGLIAIPLMKFIPPPGFRICLADKLYISAVRQTYLDTTGLCAFDEGYAPYSLHLIPISGSAHSLLNPDGGRTKRKQKVAGIKILPSRWSPKVSEKVSQK